ncbi:MAG: type 1 glutamine amidotransferase [Bauldia sp.]|nr:type 1 glutamine amidotransferase [Bauldia sp.]
MPTITKAKVLIVATHGFEQSELEVPRNRLEEAGATVTIAAPEGGQIRGWEKREWCRSVPVDIVLHDVDPSDYDALVLPGGQMNPDTLRGNDEALGLIRAFLRSGKPVAAICHAPWLLVEVDAVRGRDVTSWPTVRKDLENAGATWIDQPVVVDGSIITSRSPHDLEAFSAAIIDAIELGLPTILAPVTERRLARAE